MARNNPKPTEKLDWINDDDPTKIIAPTIAQKLAGWVKDQLPPAQRFNWFWNLISNQQIYSNAQVEDWIVIDSDPDEGDYATLVAYLADAPAAGDRVLIKEDQTVVAETVIPSNTTIKFLDSARLLCATNIATAVLKLSGNIIIEGVLNIFLSHSGTTAKAVEYDGDNVVGQINVLNTSTGTLTTAHHINAAKTGNWIQSFMRNTGGGVITKGIVDNSTEASNLIMIFDDTDKTIKTNGSAFVDLLNDQAIDGIKNFIGSELKLSSILPRFKFFEIDADVDEKFWEIRTSIGNLTIATRTDADGAGSPAIAISRTGTVVDLMNIQSTNLQHNGNKVILITDVASTTVKGPVELATSAETITGTDAARVVTPSGLQAKVASVTAKGIVELATNAEVQAGTDTERAVTPAGLASKVGETLLTKIIDIGDWDMDTTQSKSVAHGLTYANIRNVQVSIRNDANTSALDFRALNTAEITQSTIAWNSTNIVMDRPALGIFDNANYDATSYNRGWVTITYIA